MSEPKQTPVVSIQAGQLRGSSADGVCTYLGIPYAEPPVRFETAKARTPWRGVLEAVDRGPAAPHRIGELPEIDAVPLVGSGSDGGDGDYLRVNIWAPDGAHQAPVMVWIHGGGFVVGSKD